MLEHSTLLVQSWTHAPQQVGSRVWTRTITDSAGQPIGLLRFAGRPHGSWFSWLRRRRLDVYETPDASHLMSLTRSWGPLSIWHVHDAEENHVGGVYANTIVTSDSQRVGFLDRGAGCIRDSSRRILAQFAVKSESLVEVTFSPEAPASPFVRMLLLGCILTLAPWPI